MADYYNNKVFEVDAVRNRQSTVLKTVLAINAAMFLVELSAGLNGSSVSLVADSVDMLSDTLVYGFSIYAVTGGARVKAKAALLKGGIMAAFGFFVFAQVLYKIAFPQVPVFEVIGGIGFLALVANSICFALLWWHKAADINMNSIWLCCRNDAIANFSVLIAAFGVWLTHSAWPDIFVGLALSVLFLRSAHFVLRASITELRANNA